MMTITGQDFKELVSLGNTLYSRQSWELGAHQKCNFSTQLHTYLALAQVPHPLSCMHTQNYLMHTTKCANVQVPNSEPIDLLEQPHVQLTVSTSDRFWFDFDFDSDIGATLQAVFDLLFLIFANVTYSIPAVMGHEVSMMGDSMFTLWSVDSIAFS